MCLPSVCINHFCPSIPSGGKGGRKTLSLLQGSAIPPPSLPRWGASQCCQCCTADGKGKNKAAHFSTCWIVNLSLDHLQVPQQGCVTPIDVTSLRLDFSKKNAAATAELSPWKYSSWICGSERFSISSNNSFLYVQQLMAHLINSLSNTALWMRSYFKSHQEKSLLLGFRVSLTVKVFLFVVSAALVTQTESHWLIRLDLLIVHRDQL